MNPEYSMKVNGYEQGRNVSIADSVVVGKGTRISSNVVIEEDCRIGSDVFIGIGCVLRPGTVIGNRTVIGHLTVFEGECTIGDDCLIQAQCNITAGTLIEDKVFLGPGYMGANDARMVHLRRDKVPFDRRAPIIRFGARLGLRSCVLPGVVIGEQSFVGVGAVVTRDTSPFGIYLGVPAKKVGTVPRIERLSYGK